MRWAVLALTVVSFLSLTYFLRLVLVLPQPAGQKAEPQSGIAVLNAHRCLTAETKKVLTNGKEDSYAPEGNEAAATNPHQPLARADAARRQTGYDDTSADRTLMDRFEVPSATVSGVLVFRMRANGNNGNDSIQVGNLVPKTDGAHSADRYEAAVTFLSNAGAWKQTRDIYWVELGELPLASGKTLLQYINEARTNQVVDFVITDDTSVDFAGMALCLPPARGHGLTFHVRPLPKQTNESFAEFTCSPLDASQGACDPHTGDRECTTALPLLCFREERSAAPAELISSAGGLGPRRWSGGEVAATEPMRGDSFPTIADADRQCERQFGPSWRVADFHLGGRGLGFVAKLRGTGFSGSYWLDIRDQPYATCWKRGRE